MPAQKDAGRLIPFLAKHTVKCLSYRSKTATEIARGSLKSNSPNPLQALKNKTTNPVVLVALLQGAESKKLIYSLRCRNNFCLFHLSIFLSGLTLNQFRLSSPAVKKAVLFVSSRPLT